MRQKLILLLFVLPSLSVAALQAAPERPDCWQNCFRIYGVVTETYSSSARPAWRAVTVQNYGTSAARIEAPDAAGIGADLLQLGDWVVIEGRLIGVLFTCYDGVNTEATATYIYRWNGTGWTIFDPGCGCWIPWP